MTDLTELLALLETDGVGPAHDRPSLARYGALVLEANRQFNLTGAKTAAEFAAHIADSLTVAPFVEGTLVDIGSGGGLPAIPLAIVTRAPVTMIETTLKKARFLERLLAEFNLEGEVIAERAEVAAHDERLRGKFHSGTARAVATASTVVELLLPFIETGGAALLQRGTLDDRERHALEDAALVLGGSLERYVVPDGLSDRRIAIVRKVSDTQARFPRRTGIPEKRPLCM
ncbi:MAG: 16S rRNA (guanine(527)-N(7))-methyltransferase RsmG [Candidatus Baltobacteraceae bacterium]